MLITFLFYTLYSLLYSIQTVLKTWNGKENAAKPHSDKVQNTSDQSTMYCPPGFHKPHRQITAIITKHVIGCVERRKISFIAALVMNCLYFPVLSNSMTVKMQREHIFPHSLCLLTTDAKNVIFPTEARRLRHLDTHWLHCLCVTRGVSLHSIAQHNSGLEFLQKKIRAKKRRIYKAICVGGMFWPLFKKKNSVLGEREL